MHSPGAYTAFKYADERVMPVYWTLEAIGLIILIIFGRKLDAVPAWTLYGIFLMLGLAFIQPAFYV